MAKCKCSHSKAEHDEYEDFCRECCCVEYRADRGFWARLFCWIAGHSFKLTPKFGMGRTETCEFCGTVIRRRD